MNKKTYKNPLLLSLFGFGILGVIISNILAFLGSSSNIAFIIGSLTTLLVGLLTVNFRFPKKEQIRKGMKKTAMLFLASLLLAAAILAIFVLGFNSFSINDETRLILLLPAPAVLFFSTFSIPAMVAGQKFIFYGMIGIITGFLLINPLTLLGSYDIYHDKPIIPQLIVSLLLGLAIGVTSARTQMK